MATWQTPGISAPPMTDDVKVLQQYVKKLANSVALMAKDLDFILNGNLDARNIHADSIETRNLKAGSVIAEKIDVNELSAISANMGKITSGEIYGAYIATRENDYPRAELNSTADLIGAYASPNNYIQVYTPSSGFSPTIRFQTPAGAAYITYDIEDNKISITSNDASINISTNRRIELSAQDGVYLTDWNHLISNSTGKSIEEEFVKKQ